MKVSLKWLREFVDIPAGVSSGEIAEKLTFAGFEVESASDPAKDFANVFVGEILEIRPHPNADRLQVTKTSVGDALVPNNGVLDIVCGARNIAVGQKVPVATVGAIVPAGFEIKASKIRGEASNGMLCSAAELKLEASSGAEGIFILEPAARIGQSFADYLGLDDVVFELKVTPNRGDSLSHLGVARELAALFGTTLREPKAGVKIGVGARPRRAVSVQNEIGDDCPAYFGRMIEGVEIGPSPDWLKQRLESLGLRSINSVVDVTTLIMLELGQPLHAFDAEKLGDASDGISIYVRNARNVENFSTISHRQLVLASSDIVIGAGRDGTLAAALGGVMGSDLTEVSEKTKNVFLEAAEFSPARVRKTNRGHNLLTDAAYRFERGVDPNRILLALDRAAELIKKVAGGEIGGLVASAGAERRTSFHGKKIAFTLRHVERVLGVSPSAAEAEKILKTLGIQMERQGPDSWLCTAPSWRRDLELPEDLVEEIGRIWGFHQLVPRVPSGIVPFSGAIDGEEAAMDRLRDYFVSQGFFEAVNYGFSSQSEEIAIVPAPELGFVEMQGIQGREFNAMKASLLPGLIANVRHNAQRRRREIRMFEIRSVFANTKQKPVNEDRYQTGVKENRRLAFALMGPEFDEDWQSGERSVDFFSLKGLIEALCEIAGVSGVRYSRENLPPYLHPGQSAVLVQGKLSLGNCGRLHPRLEKKFDFSTPLFIAEIDLAKFAANSSKKIKYREYSKFLGIERDFSVTVPESVTSEQIRDLVMRLGKPLTQSVSFFDVYRGERVQVGEIAYAFRVELAASDHTLADSEISSAHELILKGLQSEIGAKISGLE